MLVPLTDPNHQLSMLMIETIIASKRRQAALALRAPDVNPEAEAPRRRAWSRLATVQRSANGKRAVRIFRAPAPAI
jgi:hypothetical protein